MVRNNFFLDICGCFVYDTLEFEAEVLAEAEKDYATIANGTAKIYSSAEELFADLDAEDDE